MLIEFSVSNYRSIREKVVFSMVAAPRLHKRENTFKPLVKGENFPALLKVAAIYGPNASGKSNLLKALYTLYLIAFRSPTNSSDPLPVTPFKFDQNLIDKPTEFEIHFITNETRYQFNLSLTQDKIYTERLTQYIKGKPDVLYNRDINKKDEYYFSENLEGGDTLHEAWQNLTNQKTLFISQAVANSSEKLTQLRIPYEWISKGGYYILKGLSSSWADGANNLAKKHKQFTRKISSFLQEVDVPVIDIHFPEDNPLVEHDKEETNKAKKETVNFIHKTSIGQAEINFNEQSEGTKSLVGFWLPWSVLSNGSPDQRDMLVVDEFDSSLHPEIVSHLIKTHIASNKNYQIIFTTHDTHLMSSKILRRDQFWVTNRDHNGATKLDSLHDFVGRESEDVEKRYYENRYTGLPFFKSSTNSATITSDNDDAQENSESDLE